MPQQKLPPIGSSNICEGERKNGLFSVLYLYCPNLVFLGLQSEVAMQHLEQTHGCSH